MRLALTGSIVLLFASLAGAANNLIANGALNPAFGQSGLPPGWESLTMGAPARFSVDDAVKHSSPASVRIDAAQTTRAYLRSIEAIPVVPGETITASAWVRVEHAPSDRGTVILIAEFSRAGGAGTMVEKFDVANLHKQGVWQEVKGRVTVPENMFNLHLRMGFSYSHGTCWWDDVSVTASTPIAGRIDLPDGRLSPADRSLPVQILNRDGTHGWVKASVKWKGRSTSAAVNLDGSPQQLARVPIEAGAPGKAIVKLAITSEGGKPVYSQQQTLTVPAPLVLGVPSPTHWVIEDGLPKIEGKIGIAVVDVARAAQALQIQVIDSSGRAIAAGALAKSLANGRGTFSLSFLNPLPAGDYTIRATLAQNSGKTVSAEQPWHVIHRAQAQVTLNSAGYPVYEGKAIFPLGIFNGSRFKEQAAAGFTVTHAYNAVRLEEDPEHADENALRFLDNTQKNGMKMLFMVPMKAVIAHKWDLVRQRIRMFRNHPALLAWDEEEGYARGDFKPGTLDTLRKILLEEDPHHPFMVGDPKEPITQVPPDRSNFFPVNDMDMGMWWWYPFPLKSKTRGTLLGGDEGAPGSELIPPSFLVNAHIEKPLWVGVQAYKKPNADGRFPTPVEYRAQAYLALISGGKGLMWYGGSVQGGIFVGDNPAEGHWDALARVAGELHGLADVLMSPALAKPRVSSTMISVMLKRSGARTVLAAVNRSDKALDVTIGSTLLPSGAAKVLDEQRSAEVRDSQLRDRFESYGTHVYVWGE